MPLGRRRIDRRSGRGRSCDRRAPLPAATETAEGRTAAKTAPQAVPRALSPAETTALNEATYIYLSSTRKDGSLSKPAEIWFQSANGAIYVGTRPDSWRAKRLRWGRADAKIWIGARDGPAPARQRSFRNRSGALRAVLRRPRGQISEKLAALRKRLPPRDCRTALAS